MFNKKEIKELNGKYSLLYNRITDLERKMDRQTSIVVQSAEWGYDEKSVSIKYVLKEILKLLGYEIIYKHKKEEYILKKKSKKKGK